MDNKEWTTTLGQRGTDVRLMVGGGIVVNLEDGTSLVYVGPDLPTPSLPPRVTPALYQTDSQHYLVSVLTQPKVTSFFLLVLLCYAYFYGYSLELYGWP